MKDPHVDPNEEALAACCNALDKAHALLSFIVRYEGQTTTEFVSLCRDWIEGEYDPGERSAASCEHEWLKAALDNTLLCKNCGVQRTVGSQ